MDKYEYKLKFDQMKSLTAENNYKAAAEIADTINWHKIKNVNALIKAGEIYEKTERYEESRDILLMAYDRSPIGRMIICRLAEVAIKMGKYDEARDYCQEFVEIAPHDNLKYVLKYKLSKAEGAGVNTLVSILEELKEQEYSEEWAFELACLYHKAGMSDKCIEACDELILWFGDGPYVERALELKMLYQPLSRQQEEKYRQFRQRKDGIVEVRPEDNLESGEIINEPVQIPKVQLSTERFNTQNLQEELQRSMQEIMDATEKGTVDNSMDNIKKLVEEIPYLQLPKEEGVPVETIQFPHIETDAEIDDSLKINFKELLAEDHDGQMSLFVPERGHLESQITGQLSIDEILAEWEKTKRAAETALQEAEQRKLESAKARALQEAGDIMERLADVIPKLDSGLTPKDLLEEQYLGGQPITDDKAAEMVANMNQILQQEIDRLASENAQMDEQLAVAEARKLVESAQNEFAEELEMPEIAEDEEVLDLEADSTEVADETSGIISGMMEIYEEDIPAQETMGVDAAQDLLREDTEESRISVDAGVEESVSASDDDFRTSFTKDGLAADVQELLAEHDRAFEEYQEGLLREPESVEDEESSHDMRETSINEDSSAEDILLAEAERSLREEISKENFEPTVKDVREEVRPEYEELRENIQVYQPSRKFTKEQREIFTYFVPIKGMERQLVQALGGIAKRLEAGETAAMGNLIIQGGPGSGKTVLATSMLKALQKETGKLDGRVGKIEASALNQKDPAVLLKKVAGGCLIIEKAGGISKEAAIKLSNLLAHDTSGVVVILEDTRRGIENALARDTVFASRFTEKINIPIFTSDELVSFAKSYANEQGYTIDEMGVLALYNSIGSIEKLDEATTLAEVKDIVDEAIAKAERGGLKKVFSIIASRRYDEDDYVILHEKDFGF